jgi:glycogen debranching enzyme
MRSPMFFSSMAAKTGIALLFAVPAAIHCQPHSPTFTSIAPIAFDNTGPVIRAHAEPLKPFTVAGERGVLVGQQDGTLESWLLPVKVLSHLTIEAEVEGYSVPIDVNQEAAQIEVRPDRTVITYAHIGFTVRQIMFSPADAAPGTGPVVLFEFDCLHPTDFTLRFTPELRWMWPERNEGVPSVEWVAPAPDASEKTGGFYVLHSDYPDFAAAVTMPGARPGILAPYQERPAVHPVELKLHIDPARDHGRLYPLLMAVATGRAAADSGRLGEKLAALNTGIVAAYQAHAAAFKKMLADSVSIETPDKTLDEAFKWAVISIEQLKTKALPTNETALVAGYYASGDSARPGFGWFFGRDALYTLYAVNGYGDFALTKSELEFLIRRQRNDGKIMHEYSQTAASIDWQTFPYMYAAADATPLFLLAVLDYVRTSGDVAFLTAHRDAIEKAWAFETSHAPGADQGGNGIYDNTQGTGWVESWPGGMPHQEVYLALLDQQASGAMSEIEKLLQDTAKADAAHQRADAVAKTIETQFYDRDKGCYAFSRNADGSLDRTSTVYPAMAWWSSKSVTGNSAYLAHPDDCLKQLAAHTLNTDWGLRDVSNGEKIYDGMSYHQGSVWPLFTGWAALAEYRGGQPLAGYQMLMENANLTWAQDLGADTELLSGDFYIPFGRSTSHQLWSSAMVITPTLRGLFGIDIDVQTKTITVNPHLPAGWDHAAIHDLQLPGGTGNVVFSRANGQIEVQLILKGDGNWHLKSELPAVSLDSKPSIKISTKVRMTPAKDFRIPLPALEIDPSLSTLTRVKDVSTAEEDPALMDLPGQPPIPGSRTSRFRIIRSEYGEHKLTIVAEGLAGTQGIVSVVRNARITPKVQLASTDVAGSKEADARLLIPDEGNYAPAPLVFHFPPGEGWKSMTVTLTW